jgi:hypothetical protein
MTLLFPFGPNLWAAPYNVNRSFKTDIITSYSGREQRRALIHEPRIRVDFTALETENCRREFDRYMLYAQRQEHYFADRVRFTTLPSGLAGGSAAAVLSDLPPWIVVDAVLVLTAPGRRAMRTVASISGPTSVNFTTAGIAGWPPGTKLHASWAGFLDPSISAPVLSKRKGVIEAKIAYMVNPGSEIEPEDEGTAEETLGYREVFTIPPDVFEPIDLDRVQNGAAVVDYGFGKLAHYFPVNFSTRLFTAQFTRADYDCAEYVRKFFARMKGRLGEFYMPTHTNDLIPIPIGGPVGSLVGGDSVMQVAGTDIATYYGAITTFRGIAVKRNNGVWFYRRVLSILASGGNSEFTIAGTWPFTIPFTAIDRVCWLPVWRFASDEITFEWLREDVMRCRLPIQMLEDLGEDA